jgi:anti-sigma regulatory factor (Ser/Thr protein kinase)
MRPIHTVPSRATRDAPPPGELPSDLAGSLELTLTAALDAPAAARAAVVAWMTGHVSETMLGDAQLLVGELVANSVRHADAPAGAPVSVRARVRGDILHFEVEDRGSSGSIERRTPDLQRGGGFGLNVVDLLSQRWGVERDASTMVWAELGFPAAG